MGKQRKRRTCFSPAKRCSARKAAEREKALPHSPSTAPIGSPSLQQATPQLLSAVEHSAPRTSSCMFFPSLEDSSLRAEQRKRRTCFSPAKRCSARKAAEREKALPHSPSTAPIGSPSLQQATPQLLSAVEHSAPRTSSCMFFPSLEDSSLRAEQRKRRTCFSPAKRCSACKAAEKEKALPHSPSTAPIGSPSLQQATPQLLSAVEHSAPRTSSCMFFPSLEDSSLRAETEERRREAQQPADEPLIIHGRSVADYQALYHSLADPMLRFSSGRPCPYSLALGRQIKRRLWEALSCPGYSSTALSDGCQQINEYFNAGVHVPHIELDISKEPRCQQLPRKRARH